MKSCIICRSETKDSRFDFYEKCFNTSIEELEMLYGNKKASSQHVALPKKRPKQMEATKGVCHLSFNFLPH
jgi:hypothetical protein